MKASIGNVARGVSRRQLLLGAAAAAATSGWRHLGRAAPAARHDEADSAAARSALAAAAQYLWRMQDADGGWHSPQYGVLRSGQALTPFVLDALLAAPEAAAPRDGVPRALEFIRRHVANGRLGHFDPDVLEYPVYSTAYAIRCLASAGVASDQSLAEKLRTFLANAQYGPDHGIGAENPAFGAWGFDAPPGDGRAGHLDLAHTRRALQALRCGDRRWGVVARDRSEVEARAQAFLRVVQKHPEATAHPRFPEGARPLAPPPYDGGFYFSPTAIDANKGGWGGGGAPHWRSYATATCDGILALLAAGVPRDDARVQDAAAWLAAHSDLAYPQGAPTEGAEPWGAAIRYYHFAVRAEAYRQLDWPRDQRAALARVVAALQNADGSFVNGASALMKEDDPVLCTALAVVALGNCLASDGAPG